MGLPAALVKTGDRDTVVPPMHASKLVAGLQAQWAPDRPYLLRVERSTGHGFGKGLERRRREWVDDLIFLSLTLEGLAFERPGAGVGVDHGSYSPDQSKSTMSSGSHLRYSGCA